jgi:hypothetical protein
MDLIAMAEKKSGKTIQTKKEALLALDYVEPTIREAKKETAIDMAKEQLDALGVKYKMSGNNFKPFEAIYRPNNKSNEFYDKFNRIVWEFNLGSAVKQSKSMDEAKFMSGMLSGKNFINAKLKNYPKAVGKVNQLIDMIGESNFTIEMAEWIFDFFNNASFESPVNEASKEKETEFHKKLDKLVHSTFGKRKDELEEKKLTEANVPSNIAEFAKRKGVSSLVRKVAGWAEKVGKRIAGGTAVGKNYSTLVLDLDYQQNGEIRINTDDETVTLFDEPVNSFNEFQRVYSDGQGNNLEEALVKKVISKIREAKSTPCWKGYEQKGMKEKNGKQVPNCVPKK